MAITTYTYIDHIPLICDEEIFQSTEYFIDPTQTIVAMQKPYCIKLNNIRRRILLMLNQTYTLTLKGAFNVIGAHPLTEYAYETVKYNDYKAIYLKVSAKLIAFSTNTLEFVIHPEYNTI